MVVGRGGAGAGGSGASGCGRAGVRVGEKLELLPTPSGTCSIFNFAALHFMTINEKTNHIQLKFQAARTIRYMWSSRLPKPQPQQPAKPKNQMEDPRANPEPQAYKLQSVNQAQHPKWPQGRAAGGPGTLLRQWREPGGRLRAPQA